MHRVDGIKLDDSEPVPEVIATSKYATLTQGDKLCRIKARRRCISTAQTSVNTPTVTSTVVQ